MSIDYEVCRICGEIFPDCEEYAYCDKCGNTFHMDCVGLESGEELTPDKCPICSMEIITPEDLLNFIFTEKGINRHDVENEYREWVRSDANSKGE